MSQAMENRKGRMLIGTVVSDKNDKTIVVRVETLGEASAPEEVRASPQEVYRS